MSDSANQSKEITTQNSDSKKEDNVPLLFLGNLAPEVKDADLKEFFSEVGNVRYVNIPTYKHSGESKGVGYIQYENIQQAKKAIQDLNGKKFQGRRIRVQFARSFSETEKKRQEKRQSQASKSSKRGSDIYSPEHLHRSSSITRRDYDIPRDQYEEGSKSGGSAQSLTSRKPSSPPLLQRRDLYEDRDRDLPRDRDRYERERSRDIDRYHDIYDSTDRSIYRERLRDRERDLRDQDIREWDRIRSEGRREPTVIYESVPRYRDYDRDLDRTLRDRLYERSREYYDRDGYYLDRDRDRDREYYHVIYSERAPIQYEREYEVQPFDTQAPQISSVSAQLPPPSPQLTAHEYARIRAAQHSLPPLPEYDARELEEYYQRAQPATQSTSTPSRLPPQAAPTHYIEYDDQSTIPTDIAYDSLVPKPLPAPPPLTAPQPIPGPQPLPSPQALQKMGQLGALRLPPNFDISQLVVRPSIATMIPPPPPPPQARQQSQQSQQSQQQQQPLPLPPRLAATHGLHSQYDQQIDTQNQ